MTVSMADVARHAGVSQRTVSNVVNGYIHVAPKTRARVQASLDALGYRPNAAARRLRSGRTGTVTLAIPSLGERYFADLAEAVIRAAAARGLQVLVERTGGEREAELELLNGGGTVLTDGMIMSAVSLGPDDGGIVPRPGLPLVLVGDCEPGTAIAHVGIENREAAREAVNHLLRSGRRRIALLGADHGPRRSYELRLEGYRAALADFGLVVDEDLLIACEWTAAAAAEAVSGYLSRTVQLPDGMFAMNDSSALGALPVLHELGIRVPQDLAIVGFDDIAEASRSIPSLSSVAPALDEIAAAALELIEEQFAGTAVDSPGHRVTGFELRVRQSSAF